MFRKKDSETDVPAGGEGALRRPAAEGAPKAAPSPDLPRRKVDLPTGPAGGAPSTGPGEAPSASQTPEPDAEHYSGKRLIVGEGIRLSGEISSCDRLMVLGEVEVTLNDTLALEIARSGRFTGGCEVEEADISGVYEGDLTVRKQLYVRSTGRLTGTIRYGSLQIEQGGQIAGNVSVLAEGTGGSVGAAAVAEPRRQAPLFGGGSGGADTGEADTPDG